MGRETLGSSDRGWDFDYEGLWRFATLDSADIRAWTVASDTGYRFPTARFKPRISAAADISSGDNPNSKTLGSFNTLFPKGNYFGALATTGGPDLSIFMDPPTDRNDFAPRRHCVIRLDCSMAAEPERWCVCCSGIPHSSC